MVKLIGITIATKIVPNSQYRQQVSDPLIAPYYGYLWVSEYFFS